MSKRTKKKTASKIEPPVYLEDLLHDAAIVMGAAPDAATKVRSDVKVFRLSVEASALILGDGIREFCRQVANALKDAEAPK